MGGEEMRVEKTQSSMVLVDLEWRIVPEVLNFTTMLE
jgi:hypothetical protein